MKSPRTSSLDRYADQAALRRAVRARRAAAPTPAEPPPRSRMALWIALGAGAVLILAILSDSLMRYGPLLRKVATGGRLGPPGTDLAAGTWRDPQGRFALTLPEGWQVRTGAAVAPRAALFRGPEGVEIEVEIRTLATPRLDALVAEFRAYEQEYGVQTHLRITRFGERPAIERRVRMFQKWNLVIDFLEGDQVHHLLAALPIRDAERFEPAIQAILNTYTPLPAKP